MAVDSTDVVADFTVVEEADFAVVEVADLVVVVAAVDGDDSRAQVTEPTMPSAFSLFAFWKAVTAAAVCAPNRPSVVTLKPCSTSAAWIFFTPDPLSPRCTLSLGLVTTRPATVVDDTDATVEPVARPDALVVVTPVAGASELDELATNALDVVEVATGTIPATVVVVVAVEVAPLLQLPSPNTMTRPAAHQTSGVRSINETVQPSSRWRAAGTIVTCASNRPRAAIPSRP
ncbi:MAG: hypothetical protein ABIR68_09510 [Ilumatobacteraceae bacterium]